MRLSHVFNLACGAIAATASLVAGLPLVAVGAAAVGAAGASFLSNAFIGAMFDGKGPSAGVAGLGFMALSHVTLVPAAAVLAARAVLSL